MLIAGKINRNQWYFSSQENIEWPYIGGSIVTGVHGF